MRNFTLLCIFIFCITYAHSAEPFMISQRTGSNINIEEREYFNLFPNIEGFIEANLSWDLKSDVEIKIKAQKDSILEISSVDAQNLGRYIDNFETANCWNSKESLDIKFEEIAKYAEIKHNFIEPEYTTIQTFEGMILNGRVIFADSEWIILWKDKSFFSPENALSFTEIIHYSQIEAIFLSDWTYIDGDHDNYIDNLGALQKKDYSRFESDESIIPIEIRSAFEKSKIAVAKIDKDFKDKEAEFFNNSSRLYNLSISYNIQAVEIGENELFYEGGEVPEDFLFCWDNVFTGRIHNVNLGFSREIYGRFRGKLDFTYYPDYSSSYDNIVSISGYSVSPLIEIVAFRYIPGVPTKAKDIEFTIFAGMEFMNITQTAVIPVLPQDGRDCNFDAIRHISEADTDVKAYRLGCNLDIFFDDNFSFFVNGEYDYSERIYLESFTSKYGAFNFRTQYYKYTIVKFGAGIKWHF